MLEKSSLETLAQTYINTPVMSIAASAECLVCAGANGKLYLFRIHPEFQRINNFCTITLCTREIWCIQICKGLLRNGDLFVGTDTGELINLDCRMPSLFRTVVDYFDASIYCMTHHVDLNLLALGMRYRDHAVVKILTTTNWSCVRKPIGSTSRVYMRKV